MKTTIAFRVTDTALTGDYTGGDITLDIVRDAYAGTDLLSSAGNWTTTELGRGVYLLDLPGITVHSFISLTNTKNAANIKYDGYTNDFATAAIAVRDVDNSAPAAGSLGASANGGLAAYEMSRVVGMQVLGQDLLGLAAAYQIDVAFSGTITGNGSFRLWAHEITASASHNPNSGSISLSEQTGTLIGTYNSTGWNPESIGNLYKAYLFMRPTSTDGVSSGVFTITIWDGLGSVDYKIPYDNTGSDFYVWLGGDGKLIGYGGSGPNSTLHQPVRLPTYPETNTAAIAAAVRDVDLSQPCPADSLGAYTKDTQDMVRVVGETMVSRDALPLSDCYTMTVSFSGTMGATETLKFYTGRAISNTSAMQFNGIEVFIGDLTNGVWTEAAHGTLRGAYVFVVHDTPGVSPSGLTGTLTITITDALGVHAHNYELNVIAGAGLYHYFGIDGRIIGHAGDGQKATYMMQTIRMPELTNTSIAAAVRDVDNSAPAVGSLGESINLVPTGVRDVAVASAGAGSLGRAVANAAGNAQLTLFNAYGWSITAGNPSTGSFDQTLPVGAVMYFSIRSGAGMVRSFGEYNGTWTSSNLDTWDDEANTIILDVDFEVGDTIPAGTFTITVPQTIVGGETGASRTFTLQIPTIYGIQDGSWEHTPTILFRADGSPLANTATGADPQAIAEAVRDVDNTAPVSGSFGESSREAWEAAQRTMDRVLANELLGIQDLSSISATYTGEITGGAELRIYYVQMSNRGINYSGKVLLGHVGSGGYVDNGTANGVYAAGILVSANLAGGTIAGGKLTITLVDQQGIVARDIYIDGSYAGAFWAFLGKHDGQLLGWAGEDSWDQDTMYQTVRPPVSDKFVRNKLNSLPLTMLNRFVTATSWVKADFTATTTSVITGDALLEVWGYNLVESISEPNIGGYAFGQAIMLGSFDSTGVWTFGVDWTDSTLSRDIIEVYAGGGTTGSISAGKLTISAKRYGNPDNNYEVFVTKVPAVSTGGGDGGYIMVDGSLSYQTATTGRFGSVSQAVLDTTSIAEAVRDISNDGATLGQMVKASAEIMLAQQVIGTNGLDSITATFDGTLNGTAYIEIRISDTVMWNGGFPSFDENSPNTVLLGTLTSSGWTEENHGGGFWSAALHALLKTGVGESIVGGKLTLSITDQTKQSYTQSWVMPSVGESVTTARWFGKDGSLLAYAFDGGSSIGTIVSGAASDPAAIAIAVRDELAVDGVKLGNVAHGGAAATFQTAAGVLSQESAAGAIEAAVADATLRILNHVSTDCISVCGWDGSVSSGLSITYSGALNGGRLTIMGENKTSTTNTALGYFDGTGWHKDAGWDGNTLSDDLKLLIEADASAGTGDLTPGQIVITVAHDAQKGYGYTLNPIYIPGAEQGLSVSYFARTNGEVITDSGLSWRTVSPPSDVSSVY